MVRAIYPHAADFCAVEDLPPGLRADRLRHRFDRVIDIRDFAFDPRFRGVAMIDFFLERLGLDPQAVPPDVRRNTWLAPRVRPEASAAPGYTLVCPIASMPQRTMPEEVHHRILRRLADEGGPILTQGAPPDELRHRVRHSPPQPSFAALCGLVAGAERILSTDTAIVHLADAFGVPTLAFFTTHLPAWRVRDYPLCTPVYRPAIGLPMALEFSRGPDDVAACQRAWFDPGGRLDWLDAWL